MKNYQSSLSSSSTKYTLPSTYDLFYDLNLNQVLSCYPFLRVTMFVKEDAAELNDPVMLSRLIKQYRWAGIGS